MSELSIILIIAFAFGCGFMEGWLIREGDKKRDARNKRKQPEPLFTTCTISADEMDRNNSTFNYLYEAIMRGYEDAPEPIGEPISHIELTDQYLETLPFKGIRRIK